MIHIKKFIFFTLFLIAPFCIAYLIYYYGINFPFWDQWEFVPLLKKTQMGQLALSDLWAQHNEHRIFFPRLIMLALAFLTGWNIAYELYINMILAGLNLLILYLILRRTFLGTDSTTNSWLPAAFSLLIFSPAQWENFIWGWQIMIFLNVLAATIGVWAVTHRPGKFSGVTVGIIAAMVASYSFSNGLLIWVVVGIVLIMQRERKLGLVFLWTVAFIASVVFYCCGYTRPSNHPSLLFFLNYSSKFIRYILAYLGAPIGFGNKNISIAIGLFLIFVLFYFSYKIRNLGRECFNRILPWLALSLYAILSSIITGIGRVGFGVDQALSSRYTTISTLLVISTLVIVVFWSNIRLKSHKAHEMRRAVIIFVISILILLFYILSFLGGIKNLVNASTHIQTARPCIENVDLAGEECLKILYPDPSVIRDRVKTLSKMGFIKQIQWDKLNRVDGGSMSIDLINGRLYVSLKEKIVIDTEKQRYLTMRGWANDNLKKNSGERVYLVFRRNGEEIIVPTSRERREDVAKHFGEKGYEWSGWAFKLETDNFPKGCYSVFVRILRGNRKEYFELEAKKQLCLY